ncbi:MAG: hypothetical protein M3P39_04885 [Actinomycetota bacterium]|nr:hypothetical protein [Actinomycetota bacterium]
MRRRFPGRRIVALDVLDQPGFERYLTVFRRTATRPRIFGLHNYLDVNNFRNTSLKGAAGRGTKGG